MVTYTIIHAYLSIFVIINYEHKKKKKEETFMLSFFAILVEYQLGIIPFFLT